MSTHVNPAHLPQYAALGRLLFRVGTDRLRGDAHDDATERGSDLAAELESLGPTYVKLGQLLSTRADLMSPTQLTALARLRDDVAPIPFEDVDGVVREEFDFGVDDLFASFDREPHAAASLGQVHRARLSDGRTVAVKVQRPGIGELVEDDLQVLAELARFADAHSEVGRTYGFGELVDQFARTLRAELDYTVEAANLAEMGTHLERFEHITVPTPVRGLTRPRVLTMTYVEGRSIDTVGPLGHLDLDGRVLADELFAAYLEQILGVGFVHADPHPGNVLVTPTGQLALIDLGMVTRLDPGTRVSLTKLLAAINEGRGDEVAQLVEGLGRRLDGFDPELLARGVAELVGDHQRTTLARTGAGTVIADLMAVCGDAKLRLPAELSMVGKALLNLDMVVATLDAEFDPVEAMGRHATAAFEAQLRPGANTGQFIRTALEAKEFAAELPGRANRLMDTLAAGQLTVRVDAVDSDELLRGVEKASNRLTTGLVLAAVIVGAAMTMRADIDGPRLLGYPAISIVFFVAAAVAGLTLVASIVLGDRRTRRRVRRRP